MPAVSRMYFFWGLSEASVATEAGADAAEAPPPEVPLLLVLFFGAGL